MEILKWLTPVLFIIITACTSDNSTSPPVSENDFSIGTDTQCSASHSLVGTTANLTSIAHGVNGTLTVIDDCTLEFTNFSYDGGGPAVYFYTGINGIFNNSNANQISSLLTGTVFSNDTVRLVLPGTVTLDDFDSISVWCIDFNANFGEVRI